MKKSADDRVAKPGIVAQRQGEGWKALLLVSPDLRTATVELVRAVPSAECPADTIVEMVRGSRIVPTPEESASLPERALALVHAPGRATVVVASGIAAEKWKDIDWLIPIGISSLRDYSDETVDLHEVSHFINVRSGQPLCEWPAVPKAGRDVFGKILDPDPCPFALGDRVQFDNDNPSRVIASAPGCVRFTNGHLSVEQHLEIPGDVDFKIGNIDFAGDLTIHGNVLDGFHVRSAKNIVIDGTVGAAHVEAAGTITIKGGVNGAHKGELRCGGDLHAHYLHMVRVACDGDVEVDVECHDSEVLAAGSVTISRGGIIGGQVTAGTDVSSGFIGAEMCVPTTVQAGFQAGLDAQVEHARKSVAHARELVKNLESALARYVEQPGVTIRYPSQRKTQIIQLQSRLGDARSAAKRARAELAGYLAGTSLVGASIGSLKRIYPRVTLVLDSACEEQVMTDISGPVRLVLDRAELAITRSSHRHG